MFNENKRWNECGIDEKLERLRICIVVLLIYISSIFLCLLIYAFSR